MTFKEEREYWNEILSMCAAPAAKYGIKVIVIDNPRNPKRHTHTGVKGIARPFNPVDYQKQQKNWTLFANKHIGVNLSACYDFFPYQKDGSISTTHEHITTADFKIIAAPQLKLFQDEN